MFRSEVITRNYLLLIKLKFPFHKSEQQDLVLNVATPLYTLTPYSLMIHLGLDFFFHSDLPTQNLYAFLSPSRVLLE
jgi:hypothetical protein